LNCELREIDKEEQKPIYECRSTAFGEPCDPPPIYFRNLEKILAGNYLCNSGFIAFPARFVADSSQASLKIP